MLMRICLMLSLVLCLNAAARAAYPGQPEPRTGDEIIVCGQLFHTGTPVVLWIDPGGYDFYRNDSRYAPPIAQRPESWPFLFGQRNGPLTDEEAEQVRGGNWTLDHLQERVDQFVIHFDVCGLSQTCFKVLQDRGLSVQFMCDIDGTIYQTMDLKEGAWHATIANGRSVGVEVANMGAYPLNSSRALLSEWYTKDPLTGITRITIPGRFGEGGLRTKNFVGHPARNDFVTGMIQGEMYRQYDFTPQQYEALSRLTAALCTVFPKLQCDYPREKLAFSHLPPPSTDPGASDPSTQPSAMAAYGEPGFLIPHVLSPEQYNNYQGVMGHYHVQLNKQDPGPAFQWDLLINRARSLMTISALENNARHRHQPARTIPGKSATTRPALASEIGLTSAPPVERTGRRRGRMTTQPAVQTAAGIQPTTAPATVPTTMP